MDWDEKNRIIELIIFGNRLWCKLPPRPPLLVVIFFPHGQQIFKVNIYKSYHSSPSWVHLFSMYILGKKDTNKRFFYNNQTKNFN